MKIRPIHFLVLLAIIFLSCCQSKDLNEFTLRKVSPGPEMIRKAIHVDSVSYYRDLLRINEYLNYDTTFRLATYILDIGADGTRDIYIKDNHRFNWEFEYGYFLNLSCEDDFKIIIPVQESNVYNFFEYGDIIKPTHKILDEITVLTSNHLDNNIFNLINYGESEYVYLGFQSSKITGWIKLKYLKPEQDRIDFPRIGLQIVEWAYIEISNITVKAGVYNLDHL